MVPFAGRLYPATRASGGQDEPGEWERYLDEVLPSDEDIPREVIKEQYTQLRQMEDLQGVVGSAVCCGEMDDHLTMAYLTVAFAPSGHDDPIVAAEAIYRVQLEAGRETPDDGAERAGSMPGVPGEFTSPGRLVLAVDLPTGPGVTVLRRQLVTAPPSETYPDGIELPLGTIQVFIPAPGRSYLVVLTLMTPTPDDFDEYAEAMASTVSFEPDDPALGETSK